MDRCVAGTTRAGDSRPASHRRRPERSGCLPTWLTSFGRAQSARDRFPRLMVNRRSRSCRYESLETRSSVLDRQATPKHLVAQSIQRLTTLHARRECRHARRWRLPITKLEAEQFQKAPIRDRPPQSAAGFFSEPESPPRSPRSPPGIRNAADPLVPPRVPDDGRRKTWRRRH